MLGFSGQSSSGQKPNDVARQRFPFQLQMGGGGELAQTWKKQPNSSRYEADFGRRKSVSSTISVSLTSAAFSSLRGIKGRLLTGRLQGLSSTTSSSERWTTSIGFDNTGVSCLKQL